MIGLIPDILRNQRNSHGKYGTVFYDLGRERIICNGKVIGSAKGSSLIDLTSRASDRSLESEMELAMDNSIDRSLKSNSKGMQVATLNLDLLKSLISFELNGNEVCNMKIDKRMFDQNVYFCVELYDSRDYAVLV